MDKRVLELAKIQTNHKLEDAAYTVINAVRTPTGTLEGRELYESPLLFSYLGENYYLTEQRLTHESGRVILNSYARHFEKNGKIFLQALDGALYKLSKTAPLFQKTRHALYGEPAQYQSSLCKENIPFIPAEGERVHVDERGQVYLLNLEKKTAKLCSDAGEILEAAPYPSLDNERKPQEPIDSEALKAHLLKILEKEFTYIEKRGKYPETTGLIFRAEDLDKGIAEYILREDKTIKETDPINIEFSHSACEVIQNKECSYHQIILNFTKNNYSITEERLKNDFSIAGSFGDPVENISYVKKNLVKTVLHSNVINYTLVVSIFAAKNLNTKRYETIAIQLDKVNTAIYPNLDLKKCQCAFSEHAGALFYLEEKKEEGKETEQAVKSRFLSFRKNYPLAGITEYFTENFPDMKKILEMKDAVFGQEVEPGQEIIAMGSGRKSSALEFLQGSVYVFSYPEGAYVKKDTLPPYSGANTIAYISKDSGGVEEWRMFTPHLAHKKNLIFYTPKQANTVEILPGVLPKIKTYAVHGQNTYMVYEDAPATLYYQNADKTYGGDYVGLSEPIEAVEGTVQGTYVATASGALNFIQLIPTQKIEFYVNEQRLDVQMSSIGLEIVFLYGEGIFAYVRDNAIVKEFWKLNTDPIRAVAKANYILIETADGGLWILSPATGEISRLEGETPIAAGYILENKDGKRYALKKGNPAYSIEWKQNKLLRLRAFESFSPIIEAEANGQKCAITKTHDAYKANMRGIIREGSEARLTFCEKIAQNIYLYTY